MALGRVGLQEGIAPLLLSLADPEVEVRQMSAFALGLLGDEIATPALLGALDDPDPVVQGRAAEALGRIGAVDAAPVIGALVRRHLTAAFDLDSDDLSFPLSSEVEALRLALYALGALGAYEPLADAVLQENGQPILWWWPVTHALQRTGDSRALDALVTMAAVQGRVGVAFAARGLGAIGDADAPAAAGALLALLDLERRDERVIATAIRAVADLDDPSTADALLQFASRRELSPTLRLETLEALQQHPASRGTDVFVELMTDPWPPMRAAALKALARTAPDTFMVVLSGLGRDPDWRVRLALAEGLAFADPETATYQLTLLLEDEDARVIPAVLQSLVKQQVPDVEEVLLDQLASGDVVVRKTAATLLGELGAVANSAEARAAVVSALVRAFKVAKDDASYLARAAILDALTVLGGTEAHATLTDALTDADWAIRLRAVEGLGILRPEESHAVAIRPAPGRRSVDFTVPRLVRPTVSPHVYIETDDGTIELELNVIEAPVTADNFMTLACRGFYDGLTFHRVVPNYVVDSGDPRADSEGGPGYTLRDELNQIPYLRGTVGMALDWEDTGGSQFFITLSPQPDLDGRYTAFAQVVDGMDVVDQIRQGDVIRRVLVWDGVVPSCAQRLGRDVATVREGRM
jgi:cyclophilin family peptidyl-prolyl cis-trans isomerase